MDGYPPAKLFRYNPAAVDRIRRNKEQGHGFQPGDTAPVHPEFHITLPKKKNFIFVMAM
jgi:hypothetical protein